MQRPSAATGLLELDPVLSLDFDFAVMMRGIQHENEAVERTRNRGNPRAAMARYNERVEAGQVQVIDNEAPQGELMAF